MNLLLITMNSYIIVWSYMGKHDFVYKSMCDLKRFITFFIKLFSPGLKLNKSSLKDKKYKYYGIISLIKQKW